MQRETIVASVFAAIVLLGLLAPQGEPARAARCNEPTAHTLALSFGGGLKLERGAEDGLHITRVSLDDRPTLLCRSTLALGNATLGYDCARQHARC